MQIQTKFHGTLEVGPNDLVNLVQPILGFAHVRRFVLLPHSQESPFLYLQSIERGDLCFIVVDPLIFFPGYTLPTEDIWDLGTPDEWAVLSLCTITSEQKITINLRSPIVINKNSRKGGQFVLALGYPHQYPILQEDAHASLNPEI